MKILKKITITTLVLTLALLTFVACSKEVATFTKDDSSKTKFTFNLMIIDPDESPIADTPIKVIGENANLMEIMEWYLDEKSINFVHENGMVMTISDLASDTSDGWILYVNGKMAEVGAADYIPVKNDKVEWKYVNYNEVFDF